MHAVVDDVQAPFAASIPAMLPNLHIRLAGSSSYVFEGQRLEAPVVSLIGPTNSAYQIELSAGARMVALGFLPLGWLQLVRVPAMELADGLIDGANVWGGSSVAALIEQLVDASLDGSHIDIVEQLFARSSEPRHLAPVQGADHWLERSNGLAVDALSESLDVRRRYL